MPQKNGLKTTQTISESISHKLLPTQVAFLMQMLV